MTMEADVNQLRERLSRLESRVARLEKVPQKEKETR
jgi:ubiquinone biosynthesis protein UbiJ